MQAMDHICLGDPLVEGRTTRPQAGKNHLVHEQCLVYFVVYHSYWVTQALKILHSRKNMGMQ